MKPSLRKIRRELKARKKFLNDKSLKPSELWLIMKTCDKCFLIVPRSQKCPICNKRQLISFPS